MTITNILLTIVVIIIAGVGLSYWFKKNKNAEVEQEIEKDEKTYTLETMKNYVKKRLDEITKVNLYDIGLSEEELKRRKNKKYALKKALKGCTYGDVNDKRYVKELIADLLSKEYGINESNISIYISNNVTIDKISYINNEKFLNLESIKIKVKKDCDLVIEGLCFIKCLSDTYFEVYMPGKVDIYTRDKLI